MSASSTPSSARGRRSLQPWLEEARVWAEELLGAALPSPAEVPPRLREALEYALLGGGKRLRPALVRLSCEWFGGDHERAAAPATAVELIHTYSLVHDDLPCMDDDALRRGRPTCHTVYGEAMGTLVGDALQTLAFEVLARSGSRHAAEWAACLARAAGAAGMVGGQVLDMEAEALIEGDPQAGLRREEVDRIHRLKTAALFGGAAELGAIAAGAQAAERRAAAAWGRALGLAFQATDDLLDVTGDAASLGKTPGKDARSAKPSLVACLGQEGARSEAERLTRAAEEAARALGAEDGSLPLELARLVLARQS